MFEPARPEVVSLLEDAIRAPSADNRHHVRFRIHEHGVSMFVDDDFLLSRIAHRRFLTLLSFGAVVENFRIALSVQGWTFEPAWFPRPSDPSLLLEVDWHHLTPSRPDALASHLASRHTNRRFFKGPPLSTAERTALAEAVDGAQVDLAYFDTEPLRPRLLRLMRIAETARFRTRRHHAELFESIAFEVGWNRPVDERLAPGSLEIERLARAPFKAVRRWPLMRAANWFGAHHVFGMRAADLPARLSPHLVVLTSRLPGDESGLEGGRAFQRVWLAADRIGVALQPMVASAVLTRDEDVPGGGPSQLARRLGHEWLALIGDAHPVVVFRIGRATGASLRSGRRDIASYLLDQTTQHISGD